MGKAAGFRKIDELTISKNIADPTFNRDIFLENFRGIEDLACEAIQSFLGTLPSLIRAIELAIQTKNAKQLEFSAHSLKGSLSNFYAEPAKLLAGKLEQLGRGPYLDGAEEIFSDLQTEIARFSAAITSLANELETK